MMCAGLVFCRYRLYVSLQIHNSGQQHNSVGRKGLEQEQEQEQ